MKIFGSAWLEPTDVSRASIKQVLALALRKGLFWRALMKIETHNGPSTGLSAWGDQQLSPSVNTQYSMMWTYSLKYIWEYFIGPLMVRSLSVTLRSVNRPLFVLSSFLFIFITPSSCLQRFVYTRLEYAYKFNNTIKLEFALQLHYSILITYNFRNIQNISDTLILNVCRNGLVKSTLLGFRQNGG
jgi:hypothetical protein